MLAVWAPWVAVVVAIVSVFLHARKPQETANESDPGIGSSAHISGGIAVGLGLLVAVLGYFYGDSLSGARQLGAGILVGSIIGTLCGFLGSRFDKPHSNFVAPLAIGTSALGISFLFPQTDRTLIQFGIVAGLAASTWILSIAPTHWPSIATITAGCLGAAGWMGGFGYGDHAPLAGLLLGLSMSIVGLLSQFAFPSSGRGGALASIVVSGLLNIGMAWVISNRVLFLDDVWKLVAIGVGAAIACHWIAPKEERDRSIGVALSLIIWLAVATIAFGMRRGFGMSICLASAAGTLVLCGNWRALSTLGPLAALCVYRLIREMHPDAAKAFDIGQHYGLMGLLIGAMVLVLALEWLNAVRGDRSVRIAFAGSLWVLLLYMMPTVVAIVIAAKGFVGVVAGVGIGTAIAALKGDDKPQLMALQFGAAAMLAAEYGWLTQKLDLTRDDKVKNLLGFAIAIAVLALAIVWLSKSLHAKSEAE